MSSEVAMKPNSPWNMVFLLHVALDIPLGIQGLFSVGLPFVELTNTTLVILKLYGALIIGSCAAALLGMSLHDMHPGKRALVIMFILYHMMASTILCQAPRFVPLTLGTIAESFKFTPEVAWGSAHGFLSLGFVSWWQSTLP